LDFGVRSDIESDLKGQNRLGSKCPSDKFPANSGTAAPFTPPITCHNIYNITPNNLVKPTTNGLKDLQSYGQNMCLIK
jgi:hypothetical protein